MHVYNSAAGRTAVSMGWLLKFTERVPQHYSTSDIVTHIVGERFARATHLSPLLLHISVHSSSSLRTGSCQSAFACSVPAQCLRQGKRNADTWTCCHQTCVASPSTSYPTVGEHRLQLTHPRPCPSKATVQLQLYAAYKPQMAPDGTGPALIACAWRPGLTPREPAQRSVPPVHTPCPQGLFLPPPGQGAQTAPWRQGRQERAAQCLRVARHLCRYAQCSHDSTTYMHTQMHTQGNAHAGKSCSVCQCAKSTCVAVMQRCCCAVNQHPGNAQDDDLSKLQDVILMSERTLLVMDGQGQVRSDQIRSDQIKSDHSSNRSY